MAGVVEIDCNRFTLERFELDDCDGFVRGAVVIRPFPPLVGFAIDDVALDVDVRNAGSVTDARGLELLPRCLNDVEYLFGGPPNALWVWLDS